MTGTSESMEGGIAILLLVLVAIVVAGVALVAYLTGGTLWARKTNPHGDRLDRETAEPTAPRPVPPESAFGDDDGAARRARAAERAARRRKTP